MTAVHLLAQFTSFFARPLRFEVALRNSYRLGDAIFQFQIDIIQAYKPRLSISLVHEAAAWPR